MKMEPEVKVDKMVKKYHLHVKEKATEPTHYPRPEYGRCNKGHILVEVYDERKNAFIWDCPICIRMMQEA